VVPTVSFDTPSNWPSSAVRSACNRRGSICPNSDSATLHCKVRHPKKGCSLRHAGRALTSGSIVRIPELAFPREKGPYVQETWGNMIGVIPVSPTLPPTSPFLSHRASARTRLIDRSEHLNGRADKAARRVHAQHAKLPTSLTRRYRLPAAAA
jgi:hypothetical protein